MPRKPVCRIMADSAWPDSAQRFCFAQAVRVSPGRLSDLAWRAISKIALFQNPVIRGQSNGKL
jgi:hypothetical protein